jgi:hypothetical protein
MTAFILWEQSLLAMAVVQLMKMLDVSASSRTSFAPTNPAQTGLMVHSRKSRSAIRPPREQALLPQVPAQTGLIDAQPQEIGRLSGRLASKLCSHRCLLKQVRLMHSRKSRSAIRPPREQALLPQVLLKQV